ncbi:hypothetical protein BLNAU_12079 [Blattamonas nauphoetae]|uniref:Uncharacterized protein n=1 Tax=Blattamonas nauphoetae TaxID=2049346 RepID=A0ABQ9XKE7_9EUKA|nr:hypothetical protein BLNAU_12079 [Blattamonas nauphoetae]
MDQHSHINFIAALLLFWSPKRMREHGFSFPDNELRQPLRIRRDRSYRTKSELRISNPYSIPPQNREIIFDCVYAHTSECSAAQLLSPTPPYRESHPFACEETGQMIDFSVEGVATPFNSQVLVWERRTHIDTKRSLFRSFAIDHPEIHISRSFFYKMVAPIRRAKRRTDQCGKCERLQDLEKIVDQYLKGQKIIPDELQKELDLLVIHRQQADVQRTLFKRLTSTLGEGEVWIRADFKENWKLARRQTQVNREFYSFQEITHLCLIVYYVDEGQIKSDRTHHLSVNLNHDSFFRTSRHSINLSTSPIPKCHKVPLILRHRVAFSE